MVTVTMAIAAIPIHVATRAGWIPARGGEEMEQEVRRGEQEQECSSCWCPGGQGFGQVQEQRRSFQALALSRVQENLAALAVCGQLQRHWEAENTCAGAQSP